MKHILFLLILSVNFCFGQSIYNWDNSHSNLKGFEYKNHFDLKGNIKEVLITKIETFYNRKDSSFITYTDAEKILFNKKGYLTHEYFLNKNKDYFLWEYNEYKNDTLLIYKKERSHYKTSPPTDKIHLKEEKYTYNKNNHLLTKYIRSSYQEKFFINERNTYNEQGLLIKSEFLNNHVTINNYGVCLGDGFSLNDMTHSFVYGHNIVQEKAVFDKNFRKKETQIKNDLDDYSSYYIPYHNHKFISDRNNNTIQINMDYLRIGDDYKSSIVFYKYDSKNRVLESLWKTKKGNISGSFYEYEEVNDTLKRKMKGYIQTKYGMKTLLKTLSSITEYNTDGSFKVTDYSTSQINEIEHYNKYKDLIQTTDRYNNILSETKYTYDSNQNWTQKIVFENGKITENIIRKIEYY